MLILRRGEIEFVSYEEHPEGMASFDHKNDYLVTFMLSKTTGQPKEVRRLHCIAWMKPNCVVDGWLCNLIRGEWEDALYRLNDILSTAQPTKYIPRPAISDGEIGLALELYRNHIRGGVIEMCESREDTVAIPKDKYRILHAPSNTPLPFPVKSLMRIIERGIMEQGREHWRGQYVGDAREVVLPKTCFMPLPPVKLKQLDISIMFVREPVTKLDGGNGYKLQIHGGYSGVGAVLMVSCDYNIRSNRNHLTLMKLINESWEQAYNQAGLPKVTAEHLQEFCQWKVATPFSPVTLHQIQEVCKYLQGDEALMKLSEEGIVQINFHPTSTKLEIVTL